MAWEKPKTDWDVSSIPRISDFNRIEENIKVLKEEKESKFSVLPISKGGTGATNASMARQNLGLGEVALKNLKTSSSPNITYGILEFLTNSYGEKGFIKAGPRCGFQIYWGSGHVEEDEVIYAYFASSSSSQGDPEGNGFLNANYIVVTGMASDSNGTNGNQNRNGIFVFNKSDKGFYIYNDGKSGTAYWLAIGVPTSP